MGCKKHKYKKVAIEDTSLENAMDKSIRGLAFNKDVAVKRRRCY